MAKNTTLASALAGVACSLLSTAGSAQEIGARIDETTVAITLHVDASASANGEGTPDRPFASLDAALTAAKGHLDRGQSTKVLVQPGTYRTQEVELSFKDSPAADVLLVIEGVDPERCIVSGATPIPSQAWEDLGDGLLGAPWPHDLGNWAYPWESKQTIGQRSEMLIVNGQPLRQVVLEHFKFERPDDKFTTGGTQWTYTHAEDPQQVVTPGTFGVMEREENGNRIFARPVDGAAFRNGAVEAAVARFGIRLNDKRHLVVRGLTFTHYANRTLGYGKESPLALINCDDVLIDDIRVLWNNGHGFKTGGSHWTVRDSVFNYNGLSGISGNDQDHTRYERNQTSFNNWRGKWGGVTGWFVAGIKLHVTRDNVLSDHEAIGNFASGIWYDVHCENVAIENAVSIANTGNGLFIELSQGPFDIHRALSANNSGPALNNSITGRFTVRDSILYGNTDGTRKKGDERVPEAVVNMQWYLRNDPHAKRQPITPGPAVFQRSILASGADHPGPLMRFHNGVKREDERYGQWSLRVTDNLLHQQQTAPVLVYMTPGWQWRDVSPGELSGDLPQIRFANNDFVPGLFRDPSAGDFRLRDGVTAPPALPARQIDPARLAEAAAFRDWVLGAEEDADPKTTDED